MRIATWNVNSMAARRAFVLHWLRERQPDVVCMQELKVTDEVFPRSVFDELGYKAALHCQAQWNGIGVLSRIEPEILHAGLPGTDAAGARLLTVKIGALHVTSVYVPNGKSVDHIDYRRKLEWLDAFVDHVASTRDPSAPAIIGGDFNVTPADIDSHDPVALAGQIFHTTEERARLARLLELGYIDLFRVAHPEEISFSWWDYRAGAFHRKHGLRIDLLLGTRSVAAATTKIWIDREYRKKKDGEIPSDHAPVIAEIDVPACAARG